jgi:hypothetical protein
MSPPSFTRRRAVALVGAFGLYPFERAHCTDMPNIDAQPYFAGVRRAIEALEKLGAPIATTDVHQIAALARLNDASSVEAAERILSCYTLATIAIDSNGALQLSPGGAERTLLEQGWRLFLLRVANYPRERHGIYFSTGWWNGTPGRMLPRDPFPRLAQRAQLMDTLNKGPLIEKMWLLCEIYGAVPVLRLGNEVPIANLSGLPIEYFIVQLFSRDFGSRRSQLYAAMFPNTGDTIAGSARKEFDFHSVHSRQVSLRVNDADGRGCVASITIQDHNGHIYPPQAMRLAPDMEFQPHIYRADGETILLPDGEYIVKSKRGPEYLRETQLSRIDSKQTQITMQLRRWIDPSKWGWYSGDTHIHAAGCAHYQVPTEGVSPETMIRHVRGEALSIGDVLTWGPSWYHQKQFFTGKAESPEATLEHPELQIANGTSLKPHTTPHDPESLLRYDIEVSGFPSSHCGHLILLRLKDQDYPGASVIEDWPSWNLPILEWARAQGAVSGYAHCSAGMMTESADLPNYEIPAFDSIGTNEAIVDVAHGLVDFLSGCNGPPVAELNAWYHMLNCGFRLVMVGETDYPCFSPPTNSRPGLGRSYVRLDRRPTDDAGYDAWIRNLRNGRLYYGDGRTHFLEFSVDGCSAGEELTLDRASTVEVRATVAALLEIDPTPDTLVEMREVRWHVEKARIGKSRQVPLELVVNGISSARINFTADGVPRQVRFNVALQQSSWVALRALPSGHTYVVFVKIAGKPIRASRRSAEWCRRSVEQLWTVKSPLMRESERPAAAEAFDHARKVYNAIAQESEVA